MLKNYAICLKPDEHFTDGFVYECSCPYIGHGTCLVDVCDNESRLITNCIEDKDFIFIVHCNDSIEDFIKNQYALYQYKTL